jgi:parallel beta-helix repeat protein
MTLPEARKVLGLAPDADPRPHLAEFRNARERIAEMVRAAPNEALAARYQQGLVEFDQAIAAIHQHLGSPDQPPALPDKPAVEEVPVSIPSPPKTIVLGTAPASPKVAVAEVVTEETAVPEKSGGRGLSVLAWITFLLVVAVGVTWFFQQKEKAAENQHLVRIASLEREGSNFVENRRWQEAAAKFAEIESMAPGSEVSARGRRSIEAGMGDEQTQFIGYWTGQATAELEAGRLDEAETAARKLLEKYPEDPEATAILEKIAAARFGQSRNASIAAAREALDQRKWADAISTARKVLATAPDDADANSIVADATAAMEKSAADRAKAAELLKLAIARDTGQFDQQALDWLREAKSLDPENAEIASRLEKLSSYTRTLHVPGDFATPAEALENARDRDRIVLAAGAWKGPLVIETAVELQGAGFAETKVECRPEEGSAITIGPEAKGARISGISFRHEAFAVGTDRFSAALVRGGGAAFVDCRFTEASGHGLAVIEGGQATVSRSRFADNGWNGAAAIGKGSRLEMRECESLQNFENGIESWDGAAVTLVNNRCEGNSRNGIHADNGAAAATLEGNQLIANREFGLVLASAGEGKISANTARGNLLGGIVIRAAAGKLPVTTNQATLNEGPGLILETGLPPAAYTGNSISQNKGQQTLSANLSGEAENTPAPAASSEAPPPRATIVTEPPPAAPR